MPVDMLVGMPVGMSKRTQAIIDLAALRHNVGQVQARIGEHSQVMAMVKSNAYGHGVLPVVRALPDVDIFGVACMQEAYELRAAGVTQAIAVMAGGQTQEDFEWLQRENCQPVIHDIHQIACLAAARLPGPLTVWLKMDTGMHRLGFPGDAFLSAWERLMAIPWVEQPIRLLTHLAESEQADSHVTKQQIAQFKQFTHDLPGMKSIANSGGILFHKDSIVDCVRPGIMLYGAMPDPSQDPLAHQLQPVMTLQSRLISVKSIKQGECIGYGGHYQCPETMPIGIVPMGYGDGYPRHAVNGTPVLVNNTVCPLVGRVSMDLLAVDLRPCASAKVGSSVILWGKGLAAERVAQQADTIAYTLFCQLGRRVERVVL